MENILQEVKKMSGSQKLKLYHALQKDIFSPEPVTKKELSAAAWKKISGRIIELQTGKVKGVSLEEHLKWLKQRKNAF